jgi:drug/metabolite transporter (DMT)-like permease
MGLVVALVSAGAFSTSGSLARSLSEAGWSPAAAVLARLLLAFAVLAVPAAIALRGRWRVLRRDAWPVLAYGVLAVAGCQVMFFNAVQYLSVGVALLIEYLGTILVVGWLWLRHGRRPRRLTLAGSVVAIAGLALVLNLLDGGARLDPVGVLWALGAAVGLAAYFLLAASGRDDLPPVVVATGGLGVGAVGLAAVAALGVLPMSVHFGAVDVAGHRTSWLVPVLGLGLVAGAFAYVTGIGAARALGAKLASFVGLSEVVFAVLVAWLLLGELPTVVQLAGGLLIVAGVALVRVDELREPATPAPAATGETRAPVTV